MSLFQDLGRDYLHTWCRSGCVYLFKRAAVQVSRQAIVPFDAVVRRVRDQDLVLKQMLRPALTPCPDAFTFNTRCHSVEVRRVSSSTGGRFADQICSQSEYFLLLLLLVSKHVFLRIRESGKTKDCGLKL